MPDPVAMILVMLAFGGLLCVLTGRPAEARGVAAAFAAIIIWALLLRLLGYECCIRGIVKL